MTDRSMTAPATPLPCPFCGAGMALVVGYGLDRLTVHVHAVTPIEYDGGYCRLADTALEPHEIAAWNRRVPPPGQAALVEALREIAEFHTPSQPETDAGDELSWVQRHVGTLRRIARNAFTGPVSPATLSHEASILRASLIAGGLVSDDRGWDELSLGEQTVWTWPVQALQRALPKVEGEQG